MRDTVFPIVFRKHDLIHSVSETMTRIRKFTRVQIQKDKCLSFTQWPIQDIGHYLLKVKHTNVFKEKIEEQNGTCLG